MQWDLQKIKFFTKNTTNRLELPEVKILLFNQFMNDAGISWYHLIFSEVLQVNPGKVETFLSGGLPQHPSAQVKIE